MSNSVNKDDELIILRISNIYFWFCMNMCAGTRLQRMGHCTSTLLRWQTQAATCVWQRIRLGRSAREWICRCMVGGKRVLFKMCLPSPTNTVTSSSDPVIPASHFSVPPSIADGRTNVTVTVNVQTTLSCEATGIPKPTVSWTKNGRAMNTDQNQNMYRLIQVFSLSVS